MSLNSTYRKHKALVDRVAGVCYLFTPSHATCGFHIFSLWNLHSTNFLIVWLVSTLLLALACVLLFFWLQALFPPTQSFKLQLLQESSVHSTSNSKFTFSSGKYLHQSLLNPNCFVLVPLKSQKLISNSFNSAENKPFQIIFITGTILNITLTSTCIVLRAT